MECNTQKPDSLGFDPILCLWLWDPVRLTPYYSSWMGGHGCSESCWRHVFRCDCVRMCVYCGEMGNRLSREEKTSSSICLHSLLTFTDTADLGTRAPEIQMSLGCLQSSEQD